MLPPATGLGRHRDRPLGLSRRALAPSCPLRLPLTHIRCGPGAAGCIAAQIPGRASAATLRSMPAPLERFHEARRVLEGRVHRTPILSSATAGRVLAAQGVRVADGRVYAKAEHLQKTGAFKIRGALNKMQALSAAERKAAFITLSAGNHAQGVALAAHEAGVHAVVMMPTGAVRSKVDA